MDLLVINSTLLVNVFEFLVDLVRSGTGLRIIAFYWALLQDANVEVVAFVSCGFKTNIHSGRKSPALHHSCKCSPDLG